MPTIPSAFNSPDDEFDGSGRKPFVFDIIAPDGDSILPEDVRLVLHVNPKSIQRSYTPNVTRQATMGGYVELDWGQTPAPISIDGVTGGLVHLYSGLISITGPTPSSTDAPYGMASIDVGGTRRQTITYAKFKDLMTLFESNGGIYDQHGRVVMQGQIKATYHGDTFFGWFSDFSYSEAAETPYMLTYSFTFNVSKEMKSIRTIARRSL